MTNQEAVCKILFEKNISQRELGLMCGFTGNTASTVVNSRLRGDIQISKLRKFLNALGYELVAQPIPQDPATRPADQLVLDGEPSEQLIVTRGPGRPSKQTTPGAKTVTIGTVKGKLFEF
jgi:transcriptional regulator with XRE-family HTH domain